MPNTVSAKKRVRQTKDRTLRNKNRRSSMRTVLRQIREAVEAGNKAEAQALLPLAYKRIDKAAGAHIIHENTAANRKRKLARYVNRA
jgi:small subunit ribosomal protein S20